MVGHGSTVPPSSCSALVTFDLNSTNAELGANKVATWRVHDVSNKHCEGVSRVQSRTDLSGQSFLTKTILSHKTVLDNYLSISYRLPSRLFRSNRCAFPFPRQWFLSSATSPTCTETRFWAGSCCSSWPTISARSTARTIRR